MFTTLVKRHCNLVRNAASPGAAGATNAWQSVEQYRLLGAWLVDRRSLRPDVNRCANRG